jgi:hypothetical protein
MTHTRNINYANATHKLLKKISPANSIQTSAVDAVSGFLDLTSEQLVDCIRELQRKNHRITTDAATVQTAVKLL